MTPEPPRRRYVCQICGKVLPGHDAGWRHWVACSEAAARQDAKEIRLEDEK